MLSLMEKLLEIKKLRKLKIVLVFYSLFYTFANNNKMTTDMKRIIAIAAILLQTTGICLADDWMGQLDDNAFFSQISIPGTHDSATGDGWTGFLGEMVGASMGQTQDLTIAQQLACGVRAFDLRPCVKDNELVINHGMLQTKAKFPETLKLLCQFVKEHPTEFVVVVMRHESDGDSNSNQWGSMMESCLSSTDIRAQLADYKHNITVGELRGKVLILSRDAYANNPIGGFITGWAHQADYATGTIKGPGTIAGKLYVQDFYEVLENMTAKLSGIEKLLNFSTKNNVASAKQFVVCVNCTSGYTESASTNGNRDNAVKCNKKVIDYLSDEAHAGPTGIILMDFAGTDKSDSKEVNGLKLVNTIIANNQRYTPVKKGGSTGITLFGKHQQQRSARFDLVGRQLGHGTTQTPIVIGRDKAGNIKKMLR